MDPSIERRREGPTPVRVFCPWCGVQVDLVTDWPLDQAVKWAYLAQKAHEADVHPERVRITEAELLAGYAGAGHVLVPRP